MSDGIKARVRIQVMVEVYADGGPFGEKFTLKEAWDRGGRSAEERLRRAITATGSGIKIIGEPKVETVIVVDEGK